MIWAPRLLPATPAHGLHKGSVGIVVNGSGTLNLTGVNTYTGTTTINSGTLALGGGGSIARSNGVVLTAGAFVTSGDTTIKSLAGTGGTVTLGSNVLTLANASGTFGGAIKGKGGLTLATGTEILTGNNPYTGGTTIKAGSTLQLGNGGVGGSLGSHVVDNGTLAVNHSNSVTFPGAIKGTGTLQQNGIGTLKLDNLVSPRSRPRSVPARWSWAAAARLPITSPSQLPARP